MSFILDGTIGKLTPTATFKEGVKTAPPLYIGPVTKITIDSTYAGLGVTDTVTDVQKTAQSILNPNLTFYIKPAINLYDLFVAQTGRTPLDNEVIDFIIPDNVAIFGFSTVVASFPYARSRTSYAVTVGSSWKTTNVLNLRVRGLIIGGGGDGTNLGTWLKGGDAIVGGNIHLNVYLESTGWIRGGTGGFYYDTGPAQDRYTRYQGTWPYGRAKNSWGTGVLDDSAWTSFMLVNNSTYYDHPTYYADGAKITGDVTITNV